MPSTKNLLLRVEALDSLLSNHYQHYSLDDLTAIVNEKLSGANVPVVTRRTIEYDISFLESDPFFVEIEKYRVNVLNEDDKVRSKYCLRYKIKGFSIFNHSLSKEEKYVLTEALSYFGQFDGLPDFHSLESLKMKLPDMPLKKIMLLEKNELDTNTFFAQLFNAIHQHHVIRMTYKGFNRSSKTKYILHPYLLKEYNRRWYLLALNDADNSLIIFGLERIVDITVYDKKFIEPKDDVFEWFDDIVGITNKVGVPVQKIVFWVSDRDINYIRTRPIHSSQVCHNHSTEKVLRQKYPYLEGGAFFSIYCKNNYELIQELTSYGSQLVVLSPQSIVDEIVGYIDEMSKKYLFLRK